MQPNVLDPGPATLARVPRRAFRFLHAVTIHADLARQLEAAGFTPADRNEGWRLLTHLARAMAVAHPAAPAAAQRLETEGRDFVRRVAAVVQRFAPALANIVSVNIAPGDPLLRTLPLVLDRIAALDPLTLREAATLGEALAVHGLGRDTQVRLRALLERARGVETPPAPASDEREASVLALYRWLKVWSDAARSAVTDRADLVRLGLAKRRKAGADVENDDAEASADVRVA
jgi:hypothetical protein